MCSLEVGIGVDSKSSRKASNSDFSLGKGSANAQREGGKYLMCCFVLFSFLQSLRPNP